MLKIFVTVDKHQCFKSFSQITSIRLEHSSSNAENSLVFLLTAGYNFLQASTTLCSF